MRSVEGKNGHTENKDSLPLSEISAPNVMMASALMSPVRP